MSLLAVQGGATGTGTVTLLAPITNTDRTLTLPDATGTVQVSGAAISGTTGTFSGMIAANGGGVSFPATQVPSADANTLDDYEEGTWTPAYVFGGGGSATYTTQTGTYTRIGRLVTVQIKITVNVASSPSGALEISGLPFTASATDKGSTSAPVFEGWSSFTGTLVARVGQASTLIRFFEAASGSLTNPGGKVASGCFTQLTVTYEV